jgi:polysaccharide export outer membrane protein
MKMIFTLLLALLVAPMALAQDSYRIKPGDVLRVEVLEDATLNRSALVLPDGRISLPLAGTVAAGGRSVEAVQADIASALAPNFAAAPTVFVGLEQLGQATATTGGGITVYVMGEAAKPGKYTVRSGSSILQVLAETGGMTRFAAADRIQVQRGGQVMMFDYRAVERGAAATPVVVKTGDVIVIPTRRLFE